MLGKPRSISRGVVVALLLFTVLAAGCSQEPTVVQVTATPSPTPPPTPTPVPTSTTEDVNVLVNAGFIVERMVEQNYADVAGATPEDLARFPYLPSVDTDSWEYQILRKLPFTLILKARKGRSAAGTPPGAG